MSPIAKAVPTLLELPDPNQHSRSTGPPSGTLSAPTHCVTSGNASVSPSQGVLGWMTPKSLPHQDSCPLRRLYHQPPQQTPTQGQWTPELLLEEIGIHDKTKREERAMWRHGG